MSKYDYSKELKDSLMDAAYLTRGIYAFILGFIKSGISKPSLSMSGENIAKMLMIYLTAADMLKDYLKHRKLFLGCK